jgi:prevent-host-death family protein
MVSVTALEAKTRLGSLLDRVSRGEEIIITRHEKPVARLVPEGRRDLRAAAKAVDDLLAFRARFAKRPKRSRITWKDVKSAREEGRR